MNSDDQLTLRVPRAAVALVAAILLHALAAALLSMLPATKEAQRIEITLQSPTPSPRASTTTAPAQTATPPPAQKRQRRASPPPTATSPVQPVLPPSPSEDRPKVAIAEPSPEPAPPPKPQTWQERFWKMQAPTPPPPAPTGVLAPSLSTIARVADADPALHDEENERRMAEDFGPFFRRGIEALRSQWHPDEVLNITERDPARRCGRRDRTTFAVAVIDKVGNVVDVILRSPSGCDELDREAIAAFKRVAQFPHPPAGIFVAADGTPTETARYPVRFIVSFDGGIQLDWRG